MFDLFHLTLEVEPVHDDFFSTVYHLAAKFCSLIHGKMRCFYGMNRPITEVKLHRLRLMEKRNSSFCMANVHFHTITYSTACVETGFVRFSGRLSANCSRYDKEDYPREISFSSFKNK